MVNSKKMSKSSIAVIVLSILLVLSMILGMTGAWFFTSNSGEYEGGELTYGSMAATITPGELAHYNAKNEVVDRNVVPGDYVKGSVEVKITHDVDVYYAIYDDAGNYYEVSAGKLVKLAQAPTTATAKLTNGAGLTATLDIIQEVSEDLEYLPAANGVTGGDPLTVSACTITVKVCQADNIDVVAAWDIIKA